MEFNVSIDLRVVGAVLFGLLSFGYGYNKWVASLEANGHDRGYMSFIVVIGVSVTGLGFLAIVNSLDLGLILLACFVASGTPMIVGSVLRYVRSRAHDETQAKEEIREILHE